MNARILAASLTLCAFASLPVHAKSADDYFHGAAYHYVEGKIQEAAVEAGEGLRLYPDDARLRTLAEHLDKIKDEQRGGKGDGRRETGVGRDEQQDGNSDQRDPDNGKDDGQQPPRPDENEPERGDERGEREPPPGGMSEEEARRLLDSYADDEKKEQAERRRGVRPRAGMEQDW